MRIKLKLLFRASIFIVLCSGKLFAQSPSKKQGNDAQKTKRLGEKELHHRRTVSNDLLTYEYWDQYHAGVAVKNGNYIEVKSSKNGRKLKTYDYTLDFAERQSFDFPKNSIVFQSLFPQAKVSYKNLWRVENRSLIPFQQLYVEYDSISLLADYNIIENQIISMSTNESFLSDSTIHVKVFSPDPLTTANQIYGFPLRDYNDSSYTSLMNNAQWLSLKAYYDNANDSFLAETDFIELKNIEPFNNPIGYYLSDSTEVNRSVSTFEDLMILSHVGAYQNWISSLGVNSLQNFKLLADSWGHNGGDNSSFRSYNPPRQDELVFGTGGVDDAEDADVIIHEYTHALIHEATGLHVSTFSNETRGLQEGLSDFAASCYSYKIKPWGWERLFSWDGHNEYWAGRVTNTQNALPFTSGNIYYIGEIINSALFKVARERDIDSTMKLVLEGLFLTNSNTTLTDFAQIIIDLDTLLYNGALSYDLCSSFNDRGIRTSCDSTINIDYIPNLEYTLLNSHSFSQRSGSLTIKFEEAKKHIGISVVNLLGQQIGSYNFERTKEASIAPLSQSGFYLLNLNDGEKQWTIPIHVL